MQPEMEELVHALRNIANGFKNYPKTSITILKLSSIFAEKELPKLEKFTYEVSSVISIFRTEFVMGNEYREKCFDDICKILFKAHTSVGLGNNKQALSEDLSEFWVRLKEIDESLRLMSNLAAELMLKENRSTDESQIMFHSYCYTYNVGFEALFFDVIKRIFLLLGAVKGNIHKFEEVESENIWDIREGFKLLLSELNLADINPVFLNKDRLQEKINIRNAIAHAQARYDPENDRVEFKFRDVGDENFWTRCSMCNRSIKIKPDSQHESRQKKTITYKVLPMSLFEFSERWLEIVDVIDSFRYISMVIDSMELLMTAYRVKTDAPKTKP